MNLPYGEFLRRNNKKFMYLAATTEFMVSPSEIVDVVWHQHLIFTQSYDAFCAVLGKKIAHIPSTHNRADFQTFKRAKEYTAKRYMEDFGAQPAHLWDYSDIYEPLNLEKSAFTVAKMIIIGLALFIPLLFAAFFVLRPMYLLINNPYFLISYILVVVFSMVSLRYFNRRKFRSILDSWDSGSFVFHLSALELVYLKGNEINAVIHGVVNQLVSLNRVVISNDGTLTAGQVEGIQSARYFTVLES